MNGIKKEDISGSAALIQILCYRGAISNKMIVAQL